MAEIDRYFQLMVEYKSSDLHLSTGTKPMFRRDRKMLPLKTEEPLTLQQCKTLLYEIMPRAKEQDFNQTNDTDFVYELKDVGRFRCNVYQDYRGIGGAFRLVSNTIPSKESLSLPDEVWRFAELERGLLLITGGAGSGKSTTIAALLDHINTSRSLHIIALEDPIEYVHESKRSLVTQREIRSHTDSFLSATRAALREDPDVLVLGELRDLAATRLAIEAAEAGRFVIGSLHTPSSADAISRVVDQYEPREQTLIRTLLSESLKGVIAQSLLRTIEGGMVPACEVLSMTRAISSLIREGKTQQIANALQTGAKDGSIPHNHELCRLVENNFVEPLEAYTHSLNSEDLLRLFATKRIEFQPPDAKRNVAQ